MSGPEFGAFVGALVAVLGGQALWGRWVMSKIQEARREASEADDVLHGRINEVKDTYVRRDDLMQHIARIENGQERLASAIDRVHSRLDGVLGAETGRGHNKGRTQ